MKDVIVKFKFIEILTKSFINKNKQYRVCELEIKTIRIKRKIMEEVINATELFVRHVYLRNEVLETPSLDFRTQLSKTLHSSFGCFKYLLCHILDIAPEVFP